MRRISFALAALALGGCQTIGLSSSGDAASSDEIAMATPPMQAPPTVTPSPAPYAGTGLVGMTADTLKSLWGEPALARKEAGAEMWQYGGQGRCTLLVYLYANGGASVMTVTHAEAVPGGSDEAAIAACAKSAGMPPVKPVS